MILRVYANEHFVSTRRVGAVRHRAGNGCGGKLCATFLGCSMPFFPGTSLVDLVTRALGELATLHWCT